MKRFVIYGRKSKDRKNKDGSVAENQHTFATQDWIIYSYLKTVGEEGVDYEIVAKFAETKSGAKHYSKRPLCLEAVEMCKKDRSLILLCAKAERLARDVWSGAELMKTVNFVLANAPDADDLQKHIEFVIAEREWKNTSQRFKDMHKVKKEKGEPVGAASPKYKMNANTSTVRNRVEAKERAEKLRERLCIIITTLDSPTLKSVSERLTGAKIPLPSGELGTWKPIQVSRILKRLGMTDALIRKKMEFKSIG